MLSNKRSNAVFAAIATFLGVWIVALDLAVRRSAADSNGIQQLVRRQLMHVLDPKSIDPKSIDPKTNAHLLNPLQVTRSRKVISYHSSRWEMIWLENILHWQDTKSICNAIVIEQAHLLHEYLNILCTSRLAIPYEQWCIIDDGNHQLWYNTENKDRVQVTFQRPVPDDVYVPPPQPVIPGSQHKHVMSWFVIEDERGNRYDEYIEPLISHLRFPLHKCLHPVPITPQYQFYYSNFKGWILPPPPIVAQVHQHKVYFDAGASAWDGRSTTSLTGITNAWARHGMVFDEIHAFEPHTTQETFEKTVPREWFNKVLFQQLDIASSYEDASLLTPFIPAIIKTKTVEDDYVLFKLDTTSPEAEASNLQFILGDNDAYHIDEIVWDHRMGSHYSQQEWVDMVPEVNLQDSFYMLLKLRLRGIRAHSWI